MKIYTDLIKNKCYDCSISPGLLKHSQEYRVLATLRYLFPQKYQTMTSGESPDLQDQEKGIGIEVTAAVRQDDMKASSAFSKLYQVRNSGAVEKYKRIIKSSGYSFVPISGERSAISTTGTSQSEKICFQEAIRKKKGKLQQYRNSFKRLGLAIVLPELPTTEAECHIVDWIREVFREDNNTFDFVYVLSNRFCICYDVQADHSQKREMSKEEDKLLRIIARMTAEGELSLKDQEWQ